MRWTDRTLLQLATGIVAACTGFGQVDLQLDGGGSRVDVTIDRAPFASYLFGSQRNKPILFPVRAPGGRLITRSVPLGGAGRESQDHPHQESFWFSYGDVNGFDFWSGRDGSSIRQRSVVELRSGQTGILEVVLDWLDGNGNRVLVEKRRMVFGSSDGDMFWLDHQSDLQALDGRVKMGETKEGLLGVRVAEAFQENRGKARYLDAFGRFGEDSIWGMRVPWVALQGEFEGRPLTVAIFDHPSTYNHPSYWHTRSYGLFAVNPLGRKDFVPEAAPAGVEIRPGESLHFRYRLCIYSARVARSRLNSDYQSFIR